MTDPATCLFFWMSHVGDGGRDRLQRTADDFLEAWQPEKRVTLVNTLLDRSVRLGHADRSSTGKWSMRPPALTLLPSVTVASTVRSAFWRGGLSPERRIAFVRAAENAGCWAHFTDVVWAPPRLQVAGECAAIQAVGASLGLRLEERAAEATALALPCLSLASATASPPQKLPTGVTPEQFDFDSRQWAPFKMQRPGEAVALRYTDRFGVCSYYVVLGRSVVAAASKSAAIYLAASGRISLSDYDERTFRFRTTVRLPSRFSLALCLCTGRLPQRDQEGVEIYEGIPTQVGRRVLRRLGQADLQPKIHWL